MLVLRSVCATLPNPSQLQPLGGIPITLDNYEDLFAKEVFIHDDIITHGWSELPDAQEEDQVVLWESDTTKFILKRHKRPVKSTDTMLTLVKYNHPIKWHRFFASQMEFFESQGVVFSNTLNGMSVVPSRDCIFNAERFTVPDGITVVIVGQDPYPQPNFATGFAFSVHRSVRYLPFANKKIQEELSREFPIGSQTVIHSKKLGDITMKPFIASGHGDLTRWAKCEGVFLMNTNETTKEGEPDAHKNHWLGFADSRIRYICRNNKKVVFMLWGRAAQTLKSSIGGSHLVLEASHPSASYHGTSDSFIGCNHFLKANEYRIANDLPPIDWNL